MRRFASTFKRRGHNDSRPITESAISPKQQDSTINTFKKAKNDNVVPRLLSKDNEFKFVPIPVNTQGRLAQEQEQNSLSLPAQWDLANESFLRIRSPPRPHREVLAGGTSWSRGDSQQQTESTSPRNRSADVSLSPTFKQTISENSKVASDEFRPPYFVILRHVCTKCKDKCTHDFGKQNNDPTPKTGNAHIDSSTHVLESSQRRLNAIYPNNSTGIDYEASSGTAGIVSEVKTADIAQRLLQNKNKKYYPVNEFLHSETLANEAKHDQYLVSSTMTNCNDNTANRTKSYGKVRKIKQKFDSKESVYGTLYAIPPVLRMLERCRSEICSPSNLETLKNSCGEKNENAEFNSVQKESVHSPEKKSVAFSQQTYFKHANKISDSEKPSDICSGLISSKKLKDESVPPRKEISELSKQTTNLTSHCEQPASLLGSNEAFWQCPPIREFLVHLEGNSLQTSPSYKSKSNLESNNQITSPESKEQHLCKNFSTRQEPCFNKMHTEYQQISPEDSCKSNVKKRDCTLEQLASSTLPYSGVLPNKLNDLTMKEEINFGQIGFQGTKAPFGFQSLLSDDSCQQSMVSSGRVLEEIPLINDSTIREIIKKKNRALHPAITQHPSRVQKIVKMIDTYSLFPGEIADKTRLPSQPDKDVSLTINAEKNNVHELTKGCHRSDLTDDIKKNSQVFQSKDNFKSVNPTNNRIEILPAVKHSRYAGPVVEDQLRALNDEDRKSKSINLYGAHASNWSVRYEDRACSVSHSSGSLFEEHSGHSIARSMSSETISIFSKGDQHAKRQTCKGTRNEICLKSGFTSFFQEENEFSLKEHFVQGRDIPQEAKLSRCVMNITGSQQCSQTSLDVVVPNCFNDFSSSRKPFVKGVYGKAVKSPQGINVDLESESKSNALIINGNLQVKKEHITNYMDILDCTHTVKQREEFHSIPKPSLLLSRPADDKDNKLQMVTKKTPMGRLQSLLLRESFQNCNIFQLSIDTIKTTCLSSSFSDSLVSVPLASKPGQSFLRRRPSDSRANNTCAGELFSKQQESHAEQKHSSTSDVFIAQDSLDIALENKRQAVGTLDISLELISLFTLDKIIRSAEKRFSQLFKDVRQQIEAVSSKQEDVSVLSISEKLKKDLSSILNEHYNCTEQALNRHGVQQPCQAILNDAIQYLATEEQHNSVMKNELPIRTGLGSSQSASKDMSKQTETLMGNQNSVTLLENFKCVLLKAEEQLHYLNEGFCTIDSGADLTEVMESFRSRNVNDTSLKFKNKSEKESKTAVEQNPEKSMSVSKYRQSSKSADGRFLCRETSAKLCTLTSSHSKSYMDFEHNSKSTNGAYSPLRTDNYKHGNRNSSKETVASLNLSTPGILIDSRTELFSSVMRTEDDKCAELHNSATRTKEATQSFINYLHDVISRLGAATAFKVANAKLCPGPPGSQDDVCDIKSGCGGMHSDSLTSRTTQHKLKCGGVSQVSNVMAHSINAKELNDESLFITTAANTSNVINFTSNVTSWISPSEPSAHDQYVTQKAHNTKCDINTLVKKPLHKLCRSAEAACTYAQENSGRLTSGYKEVMTHFTDASAVPVSSTALVSCTASNSDHMASSISHPSKPSFTSPCSLWSATREVNESCCQTEVSFYREINKQIDAVDNVHHVSCASSADKDYYFDLQDDVEEMKSICDETPLFSISTSEDNLSSITSNSSSSRHPVTGLKQNIRKGSSVVCPKTVELLQKSLQCIETLLQQIGIEESGGIKRENSLRARRNPNVNMSQFDRNTELQSDTASIFKRTSCSTTSYFSVDPPVLQKTLLKQNDREIHLTESSVDENQPRESSLSSSVSSQSHTSTDYILSENDDSETSPYLSEQSLFNKSRDQIISNDSKYTGIQAISSSHSAGQLIKLNTNFTSNLGSLYSDDRDRDEIHLTQSHDQENILTPYLISLNPNLITAFDTKRNNIFQRTVSQETFDFINDCNTKFSHSENFKKTISVSTTKIDGYCLHKNNNQVLGRQTENQHSIDSKMAGNQGRVFKYHEKSANFFSCLSDSLAYAETANQKMSLTNQETESTKYETRRSSLPTVVGISPNNAEDLCLPISSSSADDFHGSRSPIRVMSSTNVLRNSSTSLIGTNSFMRELKKYLRAKENQMSADCSSSSASQICTVNKPIKISISTARKVLKSYKIIGSFIKAVLQHNMIDVRDLSEFSLSPCENKGRQQNETKCTADSCRKCSSVPNIIHSGKHIDHGHFSRYLTSYPLVVRTKDTRGQDLTLCPRADSRHGKSLLTADQYDLAIEKIQDRVGSLKTKVVHMLGMIDTYDSQHQVKTHNSGAIGVTNNTIEDPGNICSCSNSPLLEKEALSGISSKSISSIVKSQDVSLSISEKLELDKLTNSVKSNDSSKHSRYSPKSKQRLNVSHDKRNQTFETEGQDASRSRRPILKDPNTQNLNKPNLEFSDGLHNIVPSAQTIYPETVNESNDKSIAINTNCQQIMKVGEYTSCVGAEQLQVVTPKHWIKSLSHNKTATAVPVSPRPELHKKTNWNSSLKRRISCGQPASLDTMKAKVSVNHPELSQTAQVETSMDDSRNNHFAIDNPLPADVDCQWLDQNHENHLPVPSSQKTLYSNDPSLHKSAFRKHTLHELLSDTPCSPRKDDGQASQQLQKIIKKFDSQTKILTDNSVKRLVKGKKESSFLLKHSEKKVGKQQKPPLVPDHLLKKERERKEHGAVEGVTRGFVLSEDYGYSALNRHVTGGRAPLASHAHTQKQPTPSSSAEELEKIMNSDLSSQKVISYRKKRQVKASTPGQNMMKGIRHKSCIPDSETLSTSSDHTPAARITSSKKIISVNESRVPLTDIKGAILHKVRKPSVFTGIPTRRMQFGSAIENEKGPSFNRLYPDTSSAGFVPQTMNENQSRESSTDCVTKVHTEEKTISKAPSSHKPYMTKGVNSVLSQLSERKSTGARFNSVRHSVLSSTCKNNEQRLQPVEESILQAEEAKDMQCNNSVKCQDGSILMPIQIEKCLGFYELNDSKKFPKSSVYTNNNFSSNGSNLKVSYLDQVNPPHEHATPIATKHLPSHSLFKEDSRVKSNLLYKSLEASSSSQQLLDLNNEKVLYRHDSDEGSITQNKKNKNKYFRDSPYAVFLQHNDIESSSSEKDVFHTSALNSSKNVLLGVTCTLSEESVHIREGKFKSGGKSAFVACTRKRESPNESQNFQQKTNTEMKWTKNFKSDSQKLVPLAGKCYSTNKSNNEINSESVPVFPSGKPIRKCVIYTLGPPLEETSTSAYFTVNTTNAKVNGNENKRADISMDNESPSIRSYFDKEVLNVSGQTDLAAVSPAKLSRKHARKCPYDPPLSSSRSLVTDENVPLWDDCESEDEQLPQKYRSVAKETSIEDPHLASPLDEPSALFVSLCIVDNTVDPDTGQPIIKVTDTGRGVHSKACDQKEYQHSNEIGLCYSSPCRHRFQEEPFMGEQTGQFPISAMTISAGSPVFQLQEESQNALHSSASFCSLSSGRIDVTTDHEFNLSPKLSLVNGNEATPFHNSTKSPSATSFINSRYRNSFNHNTKRKIPKQKGEIPKPFFDLRQKSPIYFKGFLSSQFSEVMEYNNQHQYKSRKPIKVCSQQSASDDISNFNKSSIYSFVSTDSLNSHSLTPPKGYSKYVDQTIVHKSVSCTDNTEYTDEPPRASNHCRISFCSSEPRNCITDNLKFVTEYSNHQRSQHKNTGHGISAHCADLPLSASAESSVCPFATYCSEEIMSAAEQIEIPTKLTQTRTIKKPSKAKQIRACKASIVSNQKLHCTPHFRGSHILGCIRKINNVITKPNALTRPLIETPQQKILHENAKILRLSMSKVKSSVKKNTSASKVRRQMLMDYKINKVTMKGTHYPKGVKSKYTTKDREISSYKRMYRPGMDKMDAPLSCLSQSTKVSRSENNPFSSQRHQERKKDFCSNHINDKLTSNVFHRDLNPNISNCFRASSKEDASQGPAYVDNALSCTVFDDDKDDDDINQLSLSEIIRQLNGLTNDSVEEVSSLPSIRNETLEYEPVKNAICRKTEGLPLVPVKLSEHLTGNTCYVACSLKADVSEDGAFPPYPNTAESFCPYPFTTESTLSTATNKTITDEVINFKTNTITKFECSEVCHTSIPIPVKYLQTGLELTDHLHDRQMLATEQFCHSNTSAGKTHLSGSTILTSTVDITESHQRLTSSASNTIQIQENVNPLINTLTLQVPHSSVTNYAISQTSDASKTNEKNLETKNKMNQGSLVQNGCLPKYSIKLSDPVFHNVRNSCITDCHDLETSVLPKTTSVIDLDYSKEEFLSNGNTENCLSLHDISFNANNEELERSLHKILTQPIKDKLTGITTECREVQRQTQSTSSHAIALTKKQNINHSLKQHLNEIHVTEKREILSPKESCNPHQAFKLEACDVINHVGKSALKNTPSTGESLKKKSDYSIDPHNNHNKKIINNSSALQTICNKSECEENGLCSEEKYELEVISLNSRGSHDDHVRSLNANINKQENILFNISEEDSTLNQFQPAALVCVYEESLECLNLREKMNDDMTESAKVSSVIFHETNKANNSSEYFTTLRKVGDNEPVQSTISSPQNTNYNSRKRGEMCPWKLHENFQNDNNTKTIVYVLRKDDLQRPLGDEARLSSSSDETEIDLNTIDEIVITSSSEAFLQDDERKFTDSSLSSFVLEFSSETSESDQSDKRTIKVSVHQSSPSLTKIYVRKDNKKPGPTNNVQMQVCHLISSIISRCVNSAMRALGTDDLVLCKSCEDDDSDLSELMQSMSRKRGKSCAKVSVHQRPGKVKLQSSMSSVSCALSSNNSTLLEQNDARKYFLDESDSSSSTLYSLDSRSSLMLISGDLGTSDRISYRCKVNSSPRTFARPVATMSPPKPRLAFSRRSPSTRRRTLSYSNSALSCTDSSFSCSESASCCSYITEKMARYSKSSQPKCTFKIKAAPSDPRNTSPAFTIQFSPPDDDSDIVNRVVSIGTTPKACDVSVTDVKNKCTSCTKRNKFKTYSVPCDIDYLTGINKNNEKKMKHYTLTKPPFSEDSLTKVRVRSGSPTVIRSKHPIKFIESDTASNAQSTSYSPPRYSHRNAQKTARHSHSQYSDGTTNCMVSNSCDNDTSNRNNRRKTGTKLTGIKKGDNIREIILDKISEALCDLKNKSSHHNVGKSSRHVRNFRLARKTSSSFVSTASSEDHLGREVKRRQNVYKRNTEGKIKRLSSPELEAKARLRQARKLMLEQEKYARLKQKTHRKFPKACYAMQATRKDTVDEKIRSKQRQQETARRIARIKRFTQKFEGKEESNTSNIKQYLPPSKEYPSAKEKISREFVSKKQSSPQIHYVPNSNMQKSYDQDISLKKNYGIKARSKNQNPEFEKLGNRKKSRENYTRSHSSTQEPKVTMQPFRSAHYYRGRQKRLNERAQSANQNPEIEILPSSRTHFFQSSRRPNQTNLKSSYPYNEKRSFGSTHYTGENKYNKMNSASPKLDYRKLQPGRIHFSEAPKTNSASLPRFRSKHYNKYHANYNSKPKPKTPEFRNSHRIKAHKKYDNTNPTNSPRLRSTYDTEAHKRHNRTISASPRLHYKKHGTWRVYPVEAHHKCNRTTSASPSKPHFDTKQFMSTPRIKASKRCSNYSSQTSENQTPYFNTGHFRSAQCCNERKRRNMMASDTSYSDTGQFRNVHHSECNKQFIRTHSAITKPHHEKSQHRSAYHARPHVNCKVMHCTSHVPTFETQQLTCADLIDDGFPRHTHSRIKCTVCSTPPRRSYAVDHNLHNGEHFNKCAHACVGDSLEEITAQYSSSSIPPRRKARVHSCRSEHSLLTRVCPSDECSLKKGVNSNALRQKNGCQRCYSDTSLSIESKVPLHPCSRPCSSKGISDDMFCNNRECSYLRNGIFPSRRDHTHFCDEIVSNNREHPHSSVEILSCRKDHPHDSHETPFNGRKRPHFNVGKKRRLHLTRSLSSAHTFSTTRKISNCKLFKNRQPDTLTGARHERSPCCLNCGAQEPSYLSEDRQSRHSTNTRNRSHRMSSQNMNDLTETHVSYFEHLQRLVRYIANKFMANNASNVGTKIRAQKTPDSATKSRFLLTLGDVSRMVAAVSMKAADLGITSQWRRLCSGIFSRGGTNLPQKRVTDRRSFRKSGGNKFGKTSRLTVPPKKATIRGMRSTSHLTVGLDGDREICSTTTTTEYASAFEYSTSKDENSIEITSPSEVSSRMKFDKKHSTWRFGKSRDAHSYLDHSASACRSLSTSILDGDIHRNKVNMDFCSHNRRSRPYNYRPANGCQTLPRYEGSTVNIVNTKQLIFPSTCAQSQESYTPLSSVLYSPDLDEDVYREQRNVEHKNTKTLHGKMCSVRRRSKIFTSPLPEDQ